MEIQSRSGSMVKASREFDLPALLQTSISSSTDEDAALLESNQIQQERPSLTSTLKQKPTSKPTAIKAVDVDVVAQRNRAQSHGASAEEQFELAGSYLRGEHG